MSGGGYLTTQRVLGVLMVVIGIAMAVSAIANGGGPLALGVVLGVLFAALGLARLRLARATGPRAGR